jgi:hypothetical protein
MAQNFSSSVLGTTVSGKSPVSTPRTILSPLVGHLALHAPIEHDRSKNVDFYLHRFWAVFIRTIAEAEEGAACNQCVLVRLSATSMNISFDMSL